MTTTLPTKPKSLAPADLGEPPEPLSKESLSHLSEEAYYEALWNHEQEVSEYYKQSTLHLAAKLIEAQSCAGSMREALDSLLPGLVLDLRYAEVDDDREAMRSRIDTVTKALTIAQC